MEYLEKTGKYILLSILACSLIKTVEKGSNIDKKLKIEEFLKPVMFFNIFQLNLGIGIGLGLINLGSKYLLD